MGLYEFLIRYTFCLYICIARTGNFIICGIISEKRGLHVIDTLKKFPVSVTLIEMYG